MTRMFKTQLEPYAVERVVFLQSSHNICIKKGRIEQLPAKVSRKIKFVVDHLTLRLSAWPCIDIINERLNVDHLI